MYFFDAGRTGGKAFAGFVLAASLWFVSVCGAHAQVVNGDFSAGATGWTTVTNGTTDSVTYTGGVLRATSNDIGATTTGPNIQTFGQQTFTAADRGILSYTLVSYTSTDIGDFDFPIVILNGTQNRIGTNGVLGATPRVNNDNQITTAISGFTSLAAGSRTIGFGVRTLDSGFGPGIATWDNIEFQQITQSPAAQSTLENNPLVLTGANTLRTATNATGTQTVTISVSNGTLTLGSPGSVTITGGANGTGSITFTGTATQVNTAMATLTYTPNLNFSGAETLVFSATVGGFSDTDNIPITVTPGTRSITVSKTADNTTNVPAGVTVTYTYVVTNSGNQVISNIALVDVHNGSGPAPTPANETLTSDSGTIGDSTDASSNGVWDTLGPGDQVTFTASYVVTQSDVDNLQ